MKYTRVVIGISMLIVVAVFLYGSYGSSDLAYDLRMTFLRVKYRLTGTSLEQEIERELRSSAHPIKPIFFTGTIEDNNGNGIDKVKIGFLENDADVFLIDRLKKATIFPLTYSDPNGSYILKDRYKAYGTYIPSVNQFRMVLYKQGYRAKVVELNSFEETINVILERDDS